MSRDLALGLFLGACVLLAILLITRIITPLIGGIVFAVALVLFGGLSLDSASETTHKAPTRADRDAPTVVK